MAISYSYDPVTAEVVNMALQEIVGEMGVTTERLSGSIAVAEARDYSMSLSLSDGSCLAYYGNNLQHLGASLYGTQAIIERFPLAQIADGDVFIYNDPFVTGALHQSDMALQAPIFFDGTLVAWSYSNVHVGDVGGEGLFGFAPHAKDNFSEGLTIPPVKVVVAGEPDESIFEIIGSNTRTPPLVIGDVRSSLAGNRVGATRLKELIGRFGPATFDEYGRINQKIVSDLLRGRIRRIPAGVYGQQDWVEQDAFGAETYLNVACTLRVSDGRMCFDFSGSAPQSWGYVNASRGAMLGSVAAVTLIALLPDAPVNAGVYDNIEMVLGPPGTIVNPTPPAAVSGGHVETGPRAMRAAHAVLTRAMSLSDDPWVRGRAAAWGGHTISTAVLRRRDSEHGDEYGAIIDLMAMGGGATTVSDGVDFGGMDYSIAGRQADVELVESTAPVFYLWRREIPDSGGPGLFRGGNSVEVGFVMERDTEGGDLLYFSAGGVLPTQGSRGGSPGGTPRLELYSGAFSPSTEAVQSLPGSTDFTDAGLLMPSKTTGQPLTGNDVLRLHIAAGAGWGDPLLRDPERVLADIDAGSVSALAAEVAYGVVRAQDGSLDAPATAARRLAIRQERIGGEPRAQPRNLEQPRQALRCINGDAWCDACGESLGRIRTWRESAVVVQHELAGRLQSIRVPVVAASAREFVLREYACPSCGSLFDSLIVDPDGPDEYFTPDDRDSLEGVSD